MINAHCTSTLYNQMVRNTEHGYTTTENELINKYLANECKKSVQIARIK